MGCSGRYAEAQDYNDLLCKGLDLDDADTVATVNAALDLAASDIHAALAAVGACDCSLASWALAYLKKLNVVDAAVLQNCPCGNRMSEEQRQKWMDWLEAQYDNLSTGKITVCSGDTGTGFPAFATAEFTWTTWSEEQMIVNEDLKDM